MFLILCGFFSECRRVKLTKKFSKEYLLQAVVFRFSKNLKVKQAYTKYKCKKLIIRILDHFSSVLVQPSVFVQISLPFCVPFSSSIIFKDSSSWKPFSLSIFGSVLKIFGAIFVFESLDRESKESASRYQQIAGGDHQTNNSLSNLQTNNWELNLLLIRNKEYIL